MILTVIIMYIVTIVMYTTAVRFNGINKYVPNFAWKSTILKGMKDMGIAFLVLIALYFGLSLYLVINL